jgi:integrase
MSVKVKTVEPGIWLLDTGRYLAKVQPGGRGAKPMTKTFDTIREARGWRGDQQTDYRRGDLLDPQGARTTVKTWAEHVQTTRIHRSGTAATWRSRLDNHLYPTFLASMPIGSVRKSHVDRWVKDRSRVMSPQSLKETFGYLRAIFANAKEDLLIKRDPTDNVDLPKVIRPKVVPMTIGQVQDLHGEMPDPFQLAVLIGAGCGLRISEVLGMTLEESIPFPHRVLHVVQQTAYDKDHGRHLAPVKSESSVRDIPVPKMVRDALAVHLAKYPTQDQVVWVTREDGSWTEETRRFIFTSGTGVPHLAGPFGKVVAHAVDRVGLPSDLTFHDLRHHFASLLIGQGRSIKLVQKWMGHSTSQITLDTYGHLWPEEEDLAGSAVDDAWTAYSEAGGDLVVTSGTP